MTQARGLRAAAAAALALMLLLPAAAAQAAEATTGPLEISADNMTGGRGPEGDAVFLHGNLRMKRGNVVVTSDEGRYLRAVGMLYLEGRVKLVDSTLTVTCDHASYSETEDRLQLDGNVTIVDRNTTLRAPFGTYDRRTGLAKLSGGVRGQEKQQRMEADDVTYLRDSLVVQARGHVKGFDDENKAQLEARSIDFDRRSKIAIATGDPLLRSKDDDGRETLIRALKLRVDSEAKVAEAIDSVLVERDTLRARGDYARFDDRAERGLLVGRPRAWDGETTVTGDTLELWTEQRRLRRLVVRGNAVMDYRGLRESNRGETSRLTGRRVDVFVVDNRIDSLLASGGARNAYASPPKPGRTAETNLATGDSILVFFKDKKIDRARVTGGAKGEYRADVPETDTLAVASEVVRYDGTAIEFVVPKNRIVLDGNAHLTYREMELNSRQVEFDSKKQTLVARGNPQLVDKGDKVQGHLMSYDLESRTGTIYEAETNYERGLYHGERIRKSGDNELSVFHGSYSTCDLDEPHYHFAARRMKIYLKDKLVAKPIVFYLRNVPVLALPFYVFPIKSGRHSGFLFPQFEFGFNSAGGQFLRNAGYYWAANDYFDITAAGDYYQAQPAWVLRGEGNYKVLYKFDGYFNGRFERNEQTGRDDYAVQAYHTQDLSPRTRFIGRADFVSSRDYNGSATSGQSLAQRLNRFLTSSAALSHNADWASLNLVVDRRQDLDADQSIVDPDGQGPRRGPRPGTTASLANLTETSPSLTVGFPTRTLGSLGFLKDTPLEKSLQTVYLSASARFLSLRQRTAFVDRYAPFTRTVSDTDTTFTVLDSTTVLGQRNLTRRGFSSGVSLSDSRRLFGWINVSPSLQANAVVFDFDERGNKVVPAATWSSAMGMSTTLYRTFKPPIPTVSGVRHSVTPSASVVYSPEFAGLQFRDSLGVLRERFRSFGGISLSSSEVARIGFAVDQRFQAKLQRGDKVTRLDNLLTWSTAGSYNLLYKKQKLTRGLSNLSTAFRLQPPGYVSSNLSATVDPFSRRPLRTLSWDVGLNLTSTGLRRSAQAAPLAVEQGQRSSSGEIAPSSDFRESWSLAAAVSSNGGYAGPRWSAAQSANLVVGYQLTANWRADWSMAYDLTNRAALAQRYSLTRRIHCWDAIFTRSFALRGEAEYYFRLGIRDQREIYYERGSRTQSFGGIQ